MVEGIADQMTIGLRTWPIIHMSKAKGIAGHTVIELRTWLVGKCVDFICSS